MAIETVVLTDDKTGSRASILVGRGFNCYRFEPVVHGHRYNVLWATEGFESGAERPSGSGIPLLFPFPGRIGGACFEYGGRKFRLQAADGRGNAIHGFVLDRSWHIIERQGSRLVGRFQASLDDPALLDLWPSDYRITVAYELRGNTLLLNVLIENPDTSPMPFGFGIHPYFRVPFVPQSRPEAIRVTLPARSYWELDQLLPTGRKQAIDQRRDLTRRRPFPEIDLDDVLADLSFDQGHCTMLIEDADTNHRLRMRFDDQFPVAVVYTPPHREAICVEPYTCVPDPFRLQSQGVEAGLRVLEPDESFRTTIEIAVD